MNSKVKDIPNKKEVWVSTKLEDICIKILDGTHFSPKSKEGPFKYITSKNIRNTGLDLSDISYISKEEHNLIYKRCPVKNGEILLTKDGAGTGNCCLNSLNEEFSLLSSVAVLDANPQLSFNPYILQFLQSPIGQKVIQDEISGQAITRITLEKIKKFKIPLPPLSEQKAIAEVLGSMDEAIRLNDALLEKKALRKQWLMQQLLSGHTRLPGFTGDWVEEKVKSFLTESKIPSFDKDPNKRLSVKLNLNGIEKRDVKRNESEESTIYFIRKSGQFIYGKQNLHKGAFGIIPPHLDGYESTQDLPAFDFNLKIVIPGFFYFYLSQEKVYEGLEKLATGTGSKRIHPESLFKVTINLPSLPEQQAIAEVLTAADQELDLLRQRGHLLREQKKGMMQLLLTGKVRLQGV